MTETYPDPTRHVDPSGPPYDWWAVDPPETSAAGDTPALVVHDVPGEPGARAYEPVGRAETAADLHTADAVLWEGDFVFWHDDGDEVSLQHPMAGTVEWLHPDDPTPDGPVLLERCDQVARERVLGGHRDTGAECGPAETVFALGVELGALAAAMASIILYAVRQEVAMALLAGAFATTFVYIVLANRRNGRASISRVAENAIRRYL